MLLFLLFRLRFLLDSLKVQTSERYKNKNTPKNIVTDRSTISTTTAPLFAGFLVSPLFPTCFYIENITN
jgi:hypothetical protein